MTDHPIKQAAQKRGASGPRPLSPSALFGGAGTQARLGPNRIGALDGASSSGWMVIFVDLLSLLSAFFVLLFALTKVPEESWNDLTKGLSEAFEIGDVATDGAAVSDPVILSDGQGAGSNLVYLQAVLQDRVDQLSELGPVFVEKSPQGLRIRISETVFFSPGTDRPIREAKDHAKAVVALIRQVQNKIKVEVFNDSKSLSRRAGVLGAWELSIEQSRILAHFLLDNGYPGSLVAVGRGTFDAAAFGRRREASGGEVHIVILEDRQERGLFDL